VILATVFVFIDLITVYLRYLEKKNYVNEEELQQGLEPTAADLEIKKDTSYFRVFDQSSGDPFNDSRGAYHHNLINGYHPAKLGLYQDLIEYQISKGNMTVMNMLNTKYVLQRDPQSGQPVVYSNPEAMGACWLVKNIKYVQTADEEMNALTAIQPLDTAYARASEKGKVTFLPETDSLATIQLVSNKNDSIRYLSSSTVPQFAVFSEIYYPHGWKAYIDGKETEIVKVDYCFRGLPLPAGQHTIEFRFEPASKAKGDLISYIMGNLTFAIFLGGLVWVGRRRWQEEMVMQAGTQKQTSKKSKV